MVVDFELRPSQMVQSFATNYRESDFNSNSFNNNTIINPEQFTFHGKRYRVTVNNHSIILENESSRNVHTVIPIDCLISIVQCYCEALNRKELLCKCMNENGRNYTETRSNLNTRFIRVYYATSIGKYGWKIEMIALEPSSQSDAVLNEWINAVHYLKDAFDRPKKLLVFVNPYGGKKKAPQIYAKKVEPLFQLAGVKVESYLTEYANHAKDMILNCQKSLKEYDGIVCVGGDGMFSELLNGVLLKTQVDSGVNYQSKDSTLNSPSIPIAVIPAGSTDAVAYGTTGINDPVTSTINIILGKKIKIDVCSVHQRDEEKLLSYSVTAMSYGFMGDVLADSDHNRWLGPRRYEWAGIKKFLRHRLYNGEVRLCVSTFDGSPKDKAICSKNCNQCYKSAQNLKMNDPYTDTSCISIRGRFLAVNAAIMSCRCGFSKLGMSPAAHLGNGCIDLILVSQCSRIDYLKYLLRTSLSTKSPFDLGYVDVYRVREFEFNPITGPVKGVSNKFQLSNSSIWNCDGEMINKPAVNVKVHCQLITIFGTGIELRDNNTRKCAI